MAGRPEKFAGFRSFLEDKCQELKQKGQNHFEITFTDIIAQGCPLPPSAYRHRAWWANYSSKVWYRAGFLVEKVDMRKQTVTFMRWGEVSAETDEHLSQLAEARVAFRGESNKSARAAPAQSLKPGLGTRYSKGYNSMQSTKPHPLFGAMKGTIRVVAGTDLTAPADPNWGKVYDK